MPDDAEPQAWVRIINDPSSDPLDVLRSVGTYKRYLSAIEDRAVEAARASGRTWEEIAGALGTRRQSAWVKHGPKRDRRWRSVQVEVGAEASQPSDAPAEQALIRAAVNGDAEAVDALVATQRELAFELAHQMGAPPATALAALEMLRTVVAGFDPSKNTTFANWSAWWLRQAIAQSA